MFESTKGGRLIEPMLFCLKCAFFLRAALATVQVVPHVIDSKHLQNAKSLSSYFTMRTSLIFLLYVCICHAVGWKPKSYPTRGVPKGQYGSDDVLVANEAFEQFIMAQMEEWHVPGLAMAIIEGNRTWAKVCLCDVDNILY